MKKLMILLLLVMIGCQPLLSQETASFQIVKIKQIQNNCFELTAKSKGKKYTIYSHYDESAEHVEMIKRQDVLVLKIIPFFKTETMSLAEFKNGMGVQASAEDSIQCADVTLPLNYKEISINYYGNIIKIKEMKYYTLDLNGLYKKQ